MDAQHFRERAEVLVRLANDLSLNDSGRLKLIELAGDLKKRAKELEALQYAGLRRGFAHLTNVVPK
jgi:hypothetical protein